MRTCKAAVRPGRLHNMHVLSFKTRSIHVVSKHRVAVSPACQRGIVASGAQGDLQLTRLRLTVCQAGVSALERAAKPHLQLATAKLPPGADPDRFAQAMYQWAATLTQSGANLPFVAPLKADKLAEGFQISMLKRSDKTRSFGSTADIVATVEEQEGVGPVLMVRFYEGEVAQDNKAAGWVPPVDPVQRLEVVLQECKDVDTIMANMPQAIRIAAKASSS